MVHAEHSQKLWRKIELAEGVLHAASNRFWKSPRLAENYAAFLVQLYHVVIGGLDLMSFAATRAASMQDDEVARICATYLQHHILEEKDHAAWLLDDLARLGIPAEEARACSPLPSVVSLIGEQFFWISAFHPVCVFGYLIVLEGSPPLIEQLDEICRRTGLPSSAFACLRAHAEDDPAHLEDLNRTLDEMPLTPDQERRVALSAFGTIETVSLLLDDLLAAANDPPSGRGAPLGHG